MKKTRSNIFRDIYYQPYNDYTRMKLYSSSKASLQMMQRMALLRRLKVHNGCVNSVCWNATGELILSGSDDQHLVLTNAYNYEVLTDYKTSHRANIFSAKFLPNSGDHRIVSCSGDGIILYTDLIRRTKTFNNQFNCHVGTTYEIATIPGEPHNFLSCGEDGTVRWFDLRIKDKCNASRCTEDVLVSCERAITALSVNLASPHQIAIGCSDSTVRILDRRTLGTPATGWTDTPGAVKPLCTFTVPEFEGNSYRITSLNYSPDGQDVLVSYSSDHLYLFNVKDQASVQLKKDIAVRKGEGKKQRLRSPLPVRRLRLRGDWSDTGPDARPECEGGRRSGTEIAQARPVLQTSLMQRMTDVLSRMLNDPATRAALCGGGEDSLEGVIDHQDNTQNNNENVTESSEERRDNEAERMERTQIQSNQEHQMDKSENPSTSGMQNNPGTSHSMETKEKTSSNNNIMPSNQMIEECSPVELKSNIPMEIESSLVETQKYSTQPCSSHTLDKTNDIPEDDQSSNDDSPCSSMENKQEGHMMENLQDRLTKMRVGFLEKHGSEPAVSLTYTDKSSTSATISLGVADEMIRDGYHAGPSGTSGTFSGKNHDKHIRYNDIQEKTDESAFSDSDDEDIQSEERLESSAETEMEEAIGDVRTRRESVTFDKTSVTELRVKQKYMGHRNASFFRTMIKEANFWGNDFVMSGSDCGHVFIWEKDTARLCMLLEADQHVVNCLQPHPYLPLLATAGIDYDVKLWAPINEESSFDEKFAEDLKKRNAVMLEETKDTMTVPAVFMIRMLACLNQIRRANELNHGMDRTRPEQEEERRRDRRITRWLRCFRRYCRL
ncbi:DDB1- and CUL4-associated factor 6 isoform X1 [Apis mellifera carnica]|uniref:DDB1- and CUL4-associated factor 6 isoform X1 n=1 Tax=Apis mellifera TaxID=7460 RepID=A0A7M7IEI9_APIME|nr:DDB1- and CUL4-associated factor 6 isoform X1 [Apis mellifera]KAG9432454.1 DDB1- and CUL4-associated factor 6 isoform X1 [Apis mellifera carnica]|eukprot:XP_016767115.1 DDB1- and CUL4-associated factor 6 isoform X1 [Apis mellifera]